MTLETCNRMIKKYESEENTKEVDFWKARLAKKYPQVKEETKPKKGK